MTSRRAAERVGRCFARGLRVGHAGTLDPAATGVLPVAVGGATRLTELLAEADKEYRGRVRLGVATDTDDAQGRPLGEERPVDVSREEVEEALNLFRGEILQRPPDFSAVKRGGRAAHKLARSGERPRLEPRPAVYRELELLSFDPPLLELRALVSKGTYIRALARDLGERLGCGGHLASLVRTRAGPFALDDSVGLEELRALAAEGRAGERLLRAREALPDLACVTVGEQLIRDVRRGQSRPLAEFGVAGAGPQAGARCLVVEPSGRAVCLAEILAGEDGALLVQPRKRIR
jgi:tRNA pseudouridine55 synthase